MEKNDGLEYIRKSCKEMMEKTMREAKEEAKSVAVFLIHKRKITSGRSGYKGGWK